MIYLTKETQNLLFNEVRNCKDSIMLISAFCKQSALEEIDGALSSTVVDKKMLIRFKTEDVAKGVTDYSVIEYCFEHNWKLFFNFDLHAKTYIVDKTRCILGSANMTGKGLGLNPINSNIEISGICTLDREDLKKIESIFDSSLEMTKDIKNELDTIFSQLEKNTNKATNVSWDEVLKSKYNPKSYVLFTHEFPKTQRPTHILEDLEFLEITDYCDEAVVSEKFKNCKCVKWLESILRNKEDKTIYFGELSSMLHNTVLNDPIPYRKDIKQLLSNLLSWIEYFKYDKFLIDVPRHSQRIRLA